NPRNAPGDKDFQKGSYLGPDYSNAEIQEELDELGAKYEQLSEGALMEKTADLLTQEKVIGWFQGRMEFGPRALGARSIIGDARSTEMQTKMNLKIKYRESFRPFAPAVLREEVSNYFDLEAESPYMLLVAPVKEERRKPMTEEQKKLFGIQKLKIPRSDLPAITHVDYSARVQTVTADTNPRFHALLNAFRDKTGYAVLVNTSFNVRGEPIVCTPKDAYTCFMRTEMDCLVIGDFVLLKEDQPKWQEKDNWRDKYELD
ncbi:MAG: hypothetical protein KDD70_15625, partial [Bdellovibrionales bacterium]|nr:hypothetical protein [Bdellovibrionales bacterium]